MRMGILRILSLLFLFVLAGCSTYGFSNLSKLEKMDFGEPETVSVCILKDKNVQQERVDEIVGALREEFAQYGIIIDVPLAQSWERPGFFYDSIMLDIIKEPLQPPCDKVLALVNRNEADFFWGLLLPEVLGAVENITWTKGFSVAEMGSLNQMLGFATPNSVAVHESYHFFGCEHSLSMGKCYDQIKTLKTLANAERKNGNDFFPTMTREGKVLKTRAEVNDIFHKLFTENMSSEAQTK